MYFARTASCSDGYAKIHNNHKYLLYCQVFVGRSTIGSGSYAQMPRDAYGFEYDSLVDNLSNPYIYVIGRDYHAVPLFVVKYK